MLIYLKQFILAPDWTNVVKIINISEYFDATCNADLPVKYIIKI